MSATDYSSILESASRGITDYLNDALKSGKLDRHSYDEAIENTFSTLETWLNDPHIDRISPSLKEGIRRTIESGKWQDIVNAFHRSVRFGTGGIRSMMAFDRDSIVALKEDGIDAPILKGPNTINNLVLLQTSVGVAKFGKAQTPRPFNKVVIGYDSRIRGYDLATAIAELFLAYDYAVYVFDEPCPYPEVTFAIPDDAVKADLGIFISASHNDYRYNGYKLSCSNGSQFDPDERDDMYNDYICKSKPEDIRLCPYSDAPAGKLFFLGGGSPLEGFDYAGHECSIINLHEKHRRHVQSFLLTPDLAERQKAAEDPLRIGFCAYHGAGRRAVPRLLEDVGFRGTKVITVDGLNDLDGLFPSFPSDPGQERQPDPGDPRAAKVAVEAFKKQYPGEFENLDILIGTDPDADRCGVVVKVPENQRHLYGGNDYVLLPADDMWALIVWYRLQREIEAHGAVQDAEKQFVVLSHTTSDSITRLARKHGLGVVRTWVGFAMLAAATRDVWNGDIAKYTGLVDGRDEDFVDLCHVYICDCQGIDDARSINVAAMEQSNGFSILGGPPPDRSSLGVNGHVRDKDGTFAALLAAEMAAWAKERGTSIFELIDQHIYLDPDVGLFVNSYEPDPPDGEYPGIEGDRIKKAILRRTLGYYQLAKAGDLEIAGHPVKSVCIYRTGKYDPIYPQTHEYFFPDEGVRFFFDDAKLNHLTVRPSGTGNSLRFHLQLYSPVNEGDLIAKKEELHATSKAMMDHIREMLKAPRG